MKEIFKNKKILIASIITLVVVLIFGGTYAWYVWSSGEDNKTVINVGVNSATVVFNGGSDLIGQNLIPVVNKENGIVKTIKVQTKNDTLNNISFNLYLDIVELANELKSTDFKYELYEGATLVSYGNFLEAKTVECATNSTNHIELVKGKTISTTLSTYTLYIWIDGTVDNDLAMAGKNFHFVLHADGQNAAIVEEPLVQHIVNLYNDASKTQVNAADGITYNYASDVSLMNDRLGTMTVGIDQGNIRYYGANPNNYVDIGDVYEGDYTFNNWEKVGWYYENTEECYLENNYCDTNWSDWGYEDVKACYEDEYGIGFSSAEDICGATTFSKGTPILYRIIGLFKDVELADGTTKDLVKVIRNDTIGRYSWDQSESTVNYGWGVNEWSQADLMKLLNPGYGSETVGGSLYWNSSSGTCYGYDYTNSVYTAIPCDFTNKGLSTSAQGKIETVKWNLGGWNNNSVYANQIYEYERQGNVVIPGTTCSGSSCNDPVTRKTQWSGKVALAYPSDYGYAVDLRSCSSNLYDYSDCIGTNWMYPRMTFGSSMPSWLLTPRSVNAYIAWDVDMYGGVWYGNSVYDSRGVSPVFYLDSELVIESGNGSSGNPYRLS